MSKELIVYLKTTDTCQLNCDHCFTNGNMGSKKFFNVEQTIKFFEEMHRLVPVYSGGHIAFHGGEPMLCPVNMMNEAYAGIKDLWPNIWWSVQTNLTYNLTDEKMKFFETVCNKSFGTSWDYGIRWKSPKQKAIWAENVKHLTGQGHELTVMVSLNKNLIQNVEPIQVIEEMIELGVKYVNFERITPNGNARLNDQIFPTNQELDAWSMKMWEQSKENNTWKKIGNLFLDSVLTSFVHGTYSGCRSRQCEQKIYTINASGTIGGCPNSATTEHYGTIFDPIESVIFNPKRMCNIQKEAVRNPVCGTCDVFDICNGDCHQLAWQGDLCAAPKTLMRELKIAQKSQQSLEALNGYMGQE